jgi:hypothetical protein
LYPYPFFLSDFFSILTYMYIIYPQEVSEQSTQYFYKSKSMVDTLSILSTADLLPRGDLTKKARSNRFDLFERFSNCFVI